MGYASPSRCDVEQQSGIRAHQSGQIDREKAGMVWRWQSLAKRLDMGSRLSQKWGSRFLCAYRQGCPVCIWTGNNFPCRSEEHTSELQSLMRISYAVLCLTKKKKHSVNYIGIY